MNPLDVLKMIKNPKEYVLGMTGINNNPMLQNLIRMAENGDKQGVENFARNYFKEKGQDFSQIENLFK